MVGIANGEIVVRMGRIAFKGRLWMPTRGEVRRGEVTEQSDPFLVRKLREPSLDHDIGTLIPHALPCVDAAGVEPSQEPEPPHDGACDSLGRLTTRTPLPLLASLSGVGGCQTKPPHTLLK